MSSWAGVQVRWGVVEDELAISDLLELNGLPRALAFEERFVVTEEDGEVLGALQYRMDFGRLRLGLLVVDPWAEERARAVALYAGTGDLASKMGVREVLARPLPHADYPHEAGYHRWFGGWRLNSAWPSQAHESLPASGWQRMVALLGIFTVPFHRAFHS